MFCSRYLEKRSYKCLYICTDPSQILRESYEERNQLLCITISKIKIFCFIFPNISIKKYKDLWLLNFQLWYYRSFVYQGYHLYSQILHCQLASTFFIFSKISLAKFTLQNNVSMYVVLSSKSQSKFQNKDIICCTL